MADRLSLGDVVTLNSGGPKMTVVNLRPDGQVDCIWLSNDSENVAGSLFPVEALKKFVPASGQVTGP